MQHHTSTTADARVQVGSLWIDRAHHHRLVEVIHVPDEHHVRLRPVRDVTAPAAELPRGGRATRQRLRAGAAMTSSTRPAERGARRPRARPCDPTRPRRESQGRRQPARRGDP